MRPASAAGCCCIHTRVPSLHTRSLHGCRYALTHADALSVVRASPLACIHLGCTPPTTADGQYSGAFVNEFKIFVAELRDFFNAASLTQLLDGVKGAMGQEDQQVCGGRRVVLAVSACACKVAA